MLGQHRGQRTKTGSQAVHNARLQANMSCPWHWFWLGSPHHPHAMCSTSSARHRCLVKSRRLSALPAMRLMRGWRVRAKSRRTVGCWSILDLLGTTSPSLHTCSKFAWRQSKMRTLTNPRHRGTNGRFSSQRRSSFPGCASPSCSAHTPNSVEKDSPTAQPSISMVSGHGLRRAMSWARRASRIGPRSSLLGRYFRPSTSMQRAVQTSTQKGVDAIIGSAEPAVAAEALARGPPELLPPIGRSSSALASRSPASALLRRAVRRGGIAAGSGRCSASVRLEATAMRARHARCERTSRQRSCARMR